MMSRAYKQSLTPPVQTPVGFISPQNITEPTIVQTKVKRLYNNIMHITHNPHIAPASIDIYAEIAAIKSKTTIPILRQASTCNHTDKLKEKPQATVVTQVVP